MGETIRLDLDLNGTQDAEQLRQAMAALLAQSLQLWGAFDRGEISTQELDAALAANAAAYSSLEAELHAVATATNTATTATQGATAATQNAAAATQQATSATTAATTATQAATAATNQATTANNQAAAASARVGSSSRTAANDMRQARQGFLDISRALQDFAQGGFGGILNNLEGIGRAIPALLKNPTALLTSIPAILTTVGTALYIFGGQVYNAFRGFLLGSNEIPKATDALGKVEGRMKEVTKQLDEYREKQRLTNAELVDYNRLSAEQVVLERQKAEAMKEQAKAKKFAEQDTTKEARDREQASRFADTLGTPKAREDLAKAIEAAMPQEEKQRLTNNLNEAIRKRQAFVPVQGENDIQTAQREFALDEETRKAREALNASNKRAQETARKLAADATISGDEGARQRIAQFQEQKPEAFTDFQKFAVEDANVDAARKEKQFIEQQKRGKALDEALQKKREAEDKIDEDWYQYSLELEKEQADERKKDFMERLKNELDAIKRIGKMDDIAKEFEAEAKQLGKKTPAEVFDHIKAGMEQTILGALGQRGLQIPAEFMGFAKEQAGDLARAAAGQAGAAAERGENAAAKKEAKGDEKADNDQRKAQRKIIDQSGLAARAGATYAGAKAQGATPDQAFDFTVQKALAFLNRQIGVDKFGRPVRANRNMSEEKKNLLATQIASQGRQQANQGVSKLAGQNLSATGKLLTVASQLDAEVARMEQRLNQVEQAAGNLMRKGQARQRNALKR